MASLEGILTGTVAAKEAGKVHSLCAFIESVSFELGREPKKRVVERPGGKCLPKRGVDDGPRSLAAVKRKAHGVVSLEPLVAACKIQIAVNVAEIERDVAELLSPVDHHETGFAYTCQRSYQFLGR